MQHLFYESYPPVSEANSSHLMANKLSHLCAPQGTSVSQLCHDVVWLTEEVLFRNKDVGFGGSMAQIVHYSLSLLSPYLIIAAAPTWLVFLLSWLLESSNMFLIKKSYSLFCETSIFSIFSSFGSPPPGMTLSLHLIHPLLPHCTSVTRLRLLPTPLFWKPWVVSIF